jgi:hypothetical protein
LEREGQGSRLDELRPIADDGKDFHGGRESSRLMTRKLLIGLALPLSATVGAGKTLSWYGWRRLQRV